MSAPAFPDPTWLVGCGNMAGAMVAGWRAGGLDFSSVTVIRPSGRPVDGVRTRSDYPDSQPRLVLLGFKPQKLDEVAPLLRPHIGPETIVVSMLAGVAAATIREIFPSAAAIVRIMPNLPVAQVQGVTAVYSTDLDYHAFVERCAVFTCLGMTLWCQSEEELGVIGAVASAGVAYVARFAEALGRSAEGRGISPARARSIAIQTLVGTSDFTKASGASMEEVARLVASLRGTTERGLAVLDAPDGLQQLVDRTIDAAIARGRALAAEAAAVDPPPASA